MGMGKGMGNILEEKKTRLGSWRREPKAKPGDFLPDFRTATGAAKCQDRLIVPTTA